MVLFLRKTRKTVSFPFEHYDRFFILRVSKSISDDLVKLNLFILHNFRPQFSCSISLFALPKQGIIEKCIMLQRNKNVPPLQFRIRRQAYYSLAHNLAQLYLRFGDGIHENVQACVMGSIPQEHSLFVLDKHFGEGMSTARHPLNKTTENESQTEVSPRSPPCFIF